MSNVPVVSFSGAVPAVALPAGGVRIAVNAAYPESSANLACSVAELRFKAGKEDVVPPS